MKIPKTTILLCLMAILVLGTAGCGSFMGKPAGQRHAEALARQTIKALGGRHALDSIRYLAFDFVIQKNGNEVMRRSHTWDRKTGRYRMEGIGRDKRPYVALFNVSTHEGKVYAGNTMTELFAPREALDEAYQYFQNDTAWLLGLLRLRDAGVTLNAEGKEVVAEREYQIVSATAGGGAAGALPGPQNWVYLDPAGGKPLAWSFIPAGGQPRATYLFMDWQTVGRLTLPIRLNRANSPWAIAFNRLFAMESVENNVFESVKEPVIQKVKPLEPGEKPTPLIMR